MKPLSLTIALHDESRGYEISPGRVPLALLASFAKDVQQFVRGSGREVDAGDLDVAVVEGSLGIAVAPVVAPQLQQDIRALLGSTDLSKIDAKRRVVVERWQAAARDARARFVRIASPAIERPIIIDRRSDFRALDVERWANVERYIKGELLDLGGVRESNAHVKLPNGSTLIVRTDKELIKATTDNLVYRTVHLRIRAKYNLDTHELRDPTLVEFVDYRPKVDNESFDRLLRNGAEAWKDVDDPAEWVHSLRGAN